jgi:hypothetical protein
MVETLTLWSPHKLSKNPGARWNTLNAAKVRQKNEIFTLYPGYDGMVKKPSHATDPLSYFFGYLGTPDCEALLGLPLQH